MRGGFRYKRGEGERKGGRQGGRKGGRKGGKKGGKRDLWGVKKER